jgi:hypothetical protein
MANKIILDLEFNGLPKYNFEPEIVSLMLYNTSNCKYYIKNYKTNTPITVGANICMNFDVDNSFEQKFFDKEAFEKGLEMIGATMEDEFYGFSTSLDEQVLTSYGIFFKRNTYRDLSELLRLTTTNIERLMAYEGSSIECCYYYITGQRPTFTHGTLDELLAIKSIFDFISQYELNEYYTIYPFGQYAGMPLNLYVIEYRRNADGYRFNNYDKLSESLDHYIFENEYVEDEFIDEDWRDDCVEPASFSEKELEELLTDKEQETLENKGLNSSERKPRRRVKKSSN